MISQLIFVICAQVLKTQPGKAEPDRAEPDRASVLLQSVVKTYAAMKSLSGDFTITQTAPGAPAFSVSGAFQAQRPKRYAIDAAGAMPFRFVCNGRSVLSVYKSVPAYSLTPADDVAINQTVTAVPPLTLFFNQHKLLAPNISTAYVGVETFDGVRCNVILQTLGQTTIRYTVDPNDIVVRTQVHLKQGSQEANVDASISNVVTNRTMTLTDFSVSPPDGAKEIPAPSVATHPIAPGESAPDFDLPRAGGGRVRLSEELAKHRAVLVTFWFYDCATCHEEFPEVMKLYRALKDKGLGMVAIDSFDDRKTVAEYARESGLICPVALDDGQKHFGAAKSYGVSLYPTSYLIGHDGKVLDRFVGRSEAALKAALARVRICADCLVTR